MSISFTSKLRTKSIIDFCAITLIEYYFNYLLDIFTHLEYCIYNKQIVLLEEKYARGKT
nr:MAG TPA: hypothetical protein [Caudoviricetes sp.]